MPARLVVMTGPDRGKSFDVSEELTHVGRGSDNQIVLQDPDLGEHQISLADRNGRYAVFTPVSDVVSVEGTTIPSDKWVWLPEQAEIKLSRRTQLKFELVGIKPASSAEPSEKRIGRASTAPSRTAEVENSESSGEVVVGTESLTAIPRPKKGGKIEGRKVAKFITDAGGDPLVRLGEDGHLPELALDDAARRGKKAASEEGESSGNPFLVIAALGGSVLLSVLMLVLDMGGFDSNVADVRRARDEIQRFYGDEGKTPKPYQVHLRQAQQARSRRDPVGEKREYRKVLAMLRAEGNERSFSGVTGNRDQDRELEELIGTLLQ